MYKKIDSTLRGNLREEIEELLALGDWDLALVAPAFPQAGRTTVAGYQLVDGVPVSLTPYGEEAGAPVTESHLPTLLGGSLIPFPVVAKGWAAIAGQLAASEGKIVVVDAARKADLVAVAEAIRHSPQRILPVGSAGLASALQTQWLVRPGRGVSLAKHRPVLVINGSVNPVSLEQIDRLDCRVLQLDVQRVLLADFDPEEVARRVLQQIFAGQDVAITTARSPSQVAKALELGRELGMDALGVGNQLCEALGAVVSKLIGKGDLGGMVLMGGQTANAICQQIGWLRIVDEVLPAIPLGVAGGLRVVTKSGGFGNPDALSGILRFLKELA